jgi:hypothetical protein
MNKLLCVLLLCTASIGAPNYWISCEVGGLGAFTGEHQTFSDGQLGVRGSLWGAINRVGFGAEYTHIFNDRGMAEVSWSGLTSHTEYMESSYRQLGVLFSPNTDWRTRFAFGFSSKHRESEESYYEGERTGAICDDGWESDATGQGACSGHFGVREWKTNNTPTYLLRTQAYDKVVSRLPYIGIGFWPIIVDGTYIPVFWDARYSFDRTFSFTISMGIPSFRTQKLPETWRINTESQSYRRGKTVCDVIVGSGFTAFLGISIFNMVRSQT